MEPWSAPADLPVTVTFLILLFLLAHVPSMSREKAPSALETEPGTHSSSFRNHCPNLERCEHQKSFVRKHEGKNVERNISSRRIRLQKSGASGGSPRSHRGVTTAPSRISADDVHGTGSELPGKQPAATRGNLCRLRGDAPYNGDSASNKRGAEASLGVPHCQTRCHNRRDTEPRACSG